MSKQVKFSINLTVNGQKMLVEASASSKELAKQLGIATGHAAKFNNTLKNLTNYSVLAQGVNSAIQTVTAAMEQYTSAFRTQVEAETKIEEVMRQRMNATAADVQSIKDLASAQQELGVIGDEVTLMGAQQLATFLSQRSSLETLIPSMLDLVAQQKGFKATGQDAVNIANLFGKAMQGNTSALRRVGISFTDAQEKQFKMASESERAALLCEIITQNVGHMNARLAETNAGKVQQMANAFGDWQERVGALIAPYERTLQLTANIGDALSGFVSIASAGKGCWAWILNMIKTTWDLTASISPASKWMIVLRRNIINTGIASGVATRSVKILAGAMRGILTGSAIGLVIWGITEAVEAFVNATSDAKESTDDLADAQNNISQEYASVKAQIQTDIATLKDFKGTQAEEKEMVEKLNNTYGATLGYFSSVSSWYNALVKDSQSYCDQMLIEIQIAQRRAEIEKLEKKKYNIVYNEDGTKKRYSTQRQRVGGMVWTLGGYQETGVGDVYKPSDQEKAQAEYNKANDSIKRILREVGTLDKRRQAIHHRVTGSKSLPTSGSGSAGSPTKRGGGGGSSRGGGSASVPAKVDFDEWEFVPEEEQYQKMLDDALEKVLLADHMYQNFDAVMADKIGRIQKALSKTRNPEQKKELEAKLKVANDEKAAGPEVWKETYEKALKDYDQLRMSLEPKIADAKEFRELLSLPLGEPRALEDFDKHLTYLNNLAAKADGAALKKLNADIEEMTKAREEFERSAKTAPVLDESSGIADYDSAIQFYTEEQQHADADRVMELQRTIDDLSKHRGVLALGTELPGMQKTVDEIDALTGQQRKLKIEAIGLDEITRQIERLNALLNDTENPLTPAMRKAVERMRDRYQEFGDEVKRTNKQTKAVDGISSAASAIDGLSSSISRMSEENKTLAASMAIVSAAASIAQLIAGFVGKLNQPGSTVSIWDWIAATVTGTATVVSAATQLKGIGAFAEGGVVSGPTLALVGEYAGATNNPEVIAPLSKLQNMIQSENGGGNVTFEIKERSLRGVLNKGNRYRSRR